MMMVIILLESLIKGSTLNCVWGGVGVGGGAAYTVSGLEQLLGCRLSNL